jgi:hypothetical protein
MDRGGATSQRSRTALLLAPPQPVDWAESFRLTDCVETLLATVVPAVMIALGGFIGGRVVNTIGERMKEMKELTRSVDRIGLGLEHIGRTVPTEFTNLRKEIHDVGKRNEAQLEGLKDELHDQRQQYEGRFQQIEVRLDGISGRPQVVGFPVEPRVNLRIDQERRCYRPPTGEAGEG